MQKLATSEQIFPIRASILESSSKGFELLKTYLAVSLWTQCFGDNKSNTIENTAVVRPVAGGAKLQGTVLFLNAEG